MRVETGSRLLGAVEGEMRLLGSLGSALTRLDEALKACDGNAVDEAVYAVHRVTQTLLEARRRREVLIEIEELRGGDPRFAGEIRAGLARLVSSGRALDARIRSRCCALEGLVTSWPNATGSLSDAAAPARSSGGAP